MDEYLPLFSIRFPVYRLRFAPNWWQFTASPQPKAVQGHGCQAEEGVQNRDFLLEAHEPASTRSLADKVEGFYLKALQPDPQPYRALLANIPLDQKNICASISRSRNRKAIRHRWPSPTGDSDWPWKNKARNKNSRLLSK